MSNTVRTAGRKYGIDAQYFVKNGVIVTLGHSISIMRGIVTGYLVTRWMPTTMYGEYQFAMSLIGTLSVLTLTGLPTSIARSIARQEDIPLKFTIGWYAIICSIGALALFGMIFLLPYWGRDNLWPLLLIAALLYVPSTLGANIFGGIVIGSAKFAYSLKTSLISGFLLIVTVLTMLILKPSSILLLTFMLGIPAIVYLSALKKIVKRFPSKEKSWKLLTYGFQLSIVSVPVALSWYLDKLLISALFGLNQLAVFSVALLIPEQLKVWSKELFPISFSKQAHGEDSIARRRKISIAVGIGTIIVGIGILMYMLITPHIIPLLFPLYPAEQVILLTNIAALTLITIPSTLFPQYLEARGMIRELTWANWTAAAGFTISLLLLVPTYGLLGAVLSRGIFRVIYGGYSFVAMWRMPVSR